jgi:hypothetical protein
MIAGEEHMADISEVQKKRFDFLNTLYDESKANRFVYYKKREIGAEIGVDADEAEIIVDYLRGEGLVDTTKEDVAISHYGIKEVEAARTNPKEPTDHFPANVIVVGQMIDSQISQASPGAIQYILNVDDRRVIEEIVTLLKENLDGLHLSSEQESDLLADVGTIEEQMKSSKPKWTIIKESIASITEKLQTVAAVSTIAQSALQLLSMMHH